MKAKGRWASNAFQLYLTKHAQILAPYMQAMPNIQAAFTRYIVPPVRWVVVLWFSKLLFTPIAMGIETNAMCRSLIAFG